MPSCFTKVQLYIVHPYLHSFFLCISGNIYFFFARVI